MEDEDGPFEESFLLRVPEGWNERIKKAAIAGKFPSAAAFVRRAVRGLLALYEDDPEKGSR